MRSVSLGKSALQISEIGFGTWPLSYANRPPLTHAISVLHHAFQRGITLLDTSDAYCLDETEKNYCERLIRKAIDSYEGDTSNITVATKGIMTRFDGNWARNPTPEQISKAIEDSHLALHNREKPIALWQIHWCKPLSPPSPPNDKIAPLAPLLKPVVEAISAGKIEYVGLCNCTLQQIDEALEILPPGRLVSIQNRFNFWDRSSETEGILKACQEKGLTFFPWSALGGSRNAGDAQLLHDPVLFPNLLRISREKQVSPEALTLAWMRNKYSSIVHIMSSRSFEHLDDSLSCVDIKLTREEIEAIDGDGPKEE